MTWEEYKKKSKKGNVTDIRNLQPTDIECPECGRHIFKRMDIVLTTYPETYQYECECGWIGYADT